MSILEKTTINKTISEQPLHGICLAFIRVKTQEKGPSGRLRGIYHPYILITAQKVVDDKGNEHTYATLPSRDLYRAKWPLDPMGEVSPSSQYGLSLGLAAANIFYEHAGFARDSEEDLGPQALRGLYLAKNPQIIARDGAGRMSEEKETVIFRLSLGCRAGIPKAMGSGYPSYATEDMTADWQFARENARFVDYVKVMKQLRQSKKELSSMPAPYDTDCEVRGLRFPCNAEDKATLITTSSLYALEIFARDTKDVFRTVTPTIATAPNGRSCWVDPIKMIGHDKHSGWALSGKARAEESELMRMGCFPGANKSAATVRLQANRPSEAPQGPSSFPHNLPHPQ